MIALFSSINCRYFRMVPPFVLHISRWSEKLGCLKDPSFFKYNDIFAQFDYEGKADLSYGCWN